MIRRYLVVLGVTAAGALLSMGTPISPISSAEAVVGRPATPVSYAGVARRTTRRMIYATNVYVASLPPACTVVVIEGTTLHQCGGTYYQASGTQYVVVNVE